jgi:type VI protein secretion system component Hcp
MLAAGAAAPGAALAEDELFLKFGDILGGSTDEHHNGEIVLLSYSQSFTRPASAGGGCGPITVTKLIDRSSPALIGTVLTGSRA